MLRLIVCQTCFDLVRSVRRRPRCIIEEPKDVMLLARVFSQSVQFSRQVGKTLKRDFLQNNDVFGQDDEEDAWSC